MAAPRGRIHEVVVVGGGIVGLACAWRIAQSGASVLVVEREEPGAGASGVAAGMLAPVTEAELGEATPLRLNLRGPAAWPAVEAVEQSGTAVAGVRTGDGPIPADAVVVAAGARSAELGVPDSPPVRPVKGQILRLRGAPERPPATRIVRTPRCYVVSRPGGE